MNTFLSFCRSITFHIVAGDVIDIICSYVLALHTFTYGSCDEHDNSLSCVCDWMSLFTIPSCACSIVCVFVIVVLSGDIHHILMLLSNEHVANVFGRG